MRLLVTGGTGFVGRPIINAALSRGWQVILATRQKDKVRSMHQNLNVWEFDISDGGCIQRSIENKWKLDAVVHLAAAVDYFGDSKILMRANVEATKNVLEIAKATGCEKFVYASSIEAAGPVLLSEIPAAPTHKCRPVSPYGQSKLLAEQLVLHETRGRLKTAVLRIGNVYGPDHLSFIVEIAEAILIRNRLLEFLPVYGGRFIHPVHSDDVVRGVNAALDSDTDLFLGTIGGEYARVEDLFLMCAGYLNKFVYLREARFKDHVFLRVRRDVHRYWRVCDFITYLMAGSGSRIHRAYSCEEARRDLGFSSEVNLKDGVATTLDWAVGAGLLPTEQ